MAKEANLSTSANPTWCPGCYNFMILAGVQKYVEEKIKNGKNIKTINPFIISFPYSCKGSKKYKKI
jgi:pyruvate/2-oxoacid:ferredoxin oxidoreductase beta subunit